LLLLTIRKWEVNDYKVNSFFTTKTSMRYLSLILLSLMLSCATSKNQQRGISDTASLISKMHARSATNWVKSFTFVQSTYRYQPDNTIDTVLWYETVSYPDKFRIDFGEPSLGNGVIYRQDSAYQFKQFELVGARPEVNDLLLLTGAEQVYTVDTTLARMERSGISTSLFRKDTFMKKPCYVIGERTEADPKSKEVWIEQNRMVMLRQLESAKSGKLLEIQFDEYTKVQDSWIEQWVTIKYDGHIVQTERYNDIMARDEKTLPAGIFDPTQFGQQHWYTAAVSPKFTFDVSKIDAAGLSGTTGGKVAVDYEFCIPANEKHLAAVQGIDPSLKVMKKGKGRIGCSKLQWLCMGNTHQKNWRGILDQLAALDYVDRIDQTFFE
jgi:hypothetical protein